jgi:hypothetical protein
MASAGQRRLRPSDVLVPIRSRLTPASGPDLDTAAGVDVAEPDDLTSATEAAATDAATEAAGAADVAAGDGADRRERRVQQAVLAVSLVPLVVSAVALVVGVGDSYMPASDHALTELQVRDVGRHEVLVGLYSRADWSHPGPALFYLLAPFYRLAGGASIGLNLGALAINGAAIAGMLAVARKHGGTALMATTALGCALLLRSAGAEFAHDPWNCFVTTLPFGLAVMLAWSMACGWRWALPLGVGVASCVAQAHVGFVALALPLAAGGAVALAVRSWRDAAAPGGSRGDGAEVEGDGAAGDGTEDGAGEGDDLGERGGGFADRVRRTGLVAPGLVTLGVLAVVWAPTVVDALTNEPSNLGKIVKWFREGDEGTQTVAAGIRSIAGQFSFDAEWLGGKAAVSMGGQSPFLYSSPWPWMLVPVVVAGVALWRWGGAGRRLVVTLVALLVLSVFAVVRTVGPAFDYRLRWTWMVAVLVAAAAAWAGLRAARHRSAALERGLLGGLGVALVAVSAVNVYTGATAGTPQEGDSGVLTELMPAVLDEVEGADGPVLVSDLYATGAWYVRGTALQLERRGIEARVPAEQGQLFGDRRVDRGDAAVELVVVANQYVDVLAADPSLRLLADWSDVPADELATADRDRRSLDEDLAAGRITPDEHSVAMWMVDAGLAAHTDATFYRVAIFVQEGDPAVP